MKLLAQLLFYSMIYLSTLTQVTLGQAIELEAKQFKIIDFEKIPKTDYQFQDGVLYAKADRSASVLIYPFAQIRSITQVKFDWNGEG